MPHFDRPVAWAESPLQLVGAAEWAAAHTTRVSVAGRLAAQVEETAAELTRRGALFGEQAGFYGIPWSMLRRHAHWLVGDGFSGQFRAAVALLRPRRLTFLDDGIASIALADSLVGARPFVRPDVAERPLARRLAPFAIDTIRMRAAAGEASLFTTFELGDARERRLSDLGASIERHSFEWLRRGATATPASTDALYDRVVLGSARVVDGHIPQREYLSWVARQSRDAPVSYLPHRRETSVDLAAVAGVSNVHIVRTGLPIELALAGQTRPREIVTLPSSAVVTLRRVLAGTGTIVREESISDRARAENAG